MRPPIDVIPKSGVFTSGARNLACSANILADVHRSRRTAPVVQNMMLAGSVAPIENAELRDGVADA